MTTTPKPKDIINLILIALRSSYKYVYVNSILYVSDGGVYRPVEDHILERQIELQRGAAGVLEEEVTGWVKHEIAEHIKASAALTMDEFEKQDNKDLLAFQNGYIDITELMIDREIKLHNFSDVKGAIFIQQVPHNVVSIKNDAITYLKEKAPIAYKFLAESVGEKNVMLQLQKIGYCFWRRNPYKRMFFEVGPADSGKTTYINLLIFILGRRNICSVKLQEISENSFASSSLFNKLANPCDDLPHDPITSTGVLKMLTGESPVSADRKHSTRIEFYNYAKLIFAANQLPFMKIKNDDAFFSRIIITQYANKFPRNEGFKKSLYTEANAEAIITSSLLSLINLAEQGGFNEQEGVKERWLREIDSVYRFIRESIDNRTLAQDSDNFIDRDRLYEMYAEYMQSEGQTAQEKNTMTRTLASTFGVVVKQKSDGGRRFYAYAGLGFQPTDIPPKPTGQQGITQQSQPTDHASPVIPQAEGPQRAMTPAAAADLGTQGHDAAEHIAKARKLAPDLFNPKDLKTEGICPACGKGKKLYDTGKEYTCMDCWNAHQHKDDAE